MIAKHIPMRAARKSSFANLEDYLTDDKKKQERLGVVTVTNCIQTESKAAVLEILAVQGMNTRATSDKTYHMVISFPPGENPSADELKAIEARICASLGYGDHQRISAVHHDTDSLHVHVAINKIHPTKHTMIEPYRDYKTLGDICTKLEHEYGLQKTNHVSKKTPSENRADDMERHSGIESLLSWVRSKCKEQLISAGSWEAVHEVMQSHGLQMRERGNGLVIIDQSGQAVKASSVAREFSKFKLEERLGQFELITERERHAPVNRSFNYDKAKQIKHNKPNVAPIGKKPPPESRNRLRSIAELGSLPIDSTESMKPEATTYTRQPKPTPTKFNTVELYARYKSDQSRLNDIRTEQLNKIRQRKSALIDQTKKRSALYRAAIKLLGGGRLSKRILYNFAYKNLQSNIKRIDREYQVNRKKIYERYSRKTWADWLQQEASNGNTDSLKALRARKTSNAPVNKADAISGNNTKSTATTGNNRQHQDSVTKQGTIIYRFSNTTFRDDGDNLKVTGQFTEKGLEAGLRMAMQRYGKSIHVTGSDAFKDEIVRAAVKSQIPIVFDDAALEQRRQSLLNKESKYDESIRRASADGHVHAGSADNRTRRNDRNERAGRGVNDKPNLGRVGTQPPPEARNRLRDMSELGMARIDSGSSVFLPSNVPGSLENKRAESSDSLRWDISRSGLNPSTPTPAQLAADKYIAEREAKRKLGFDIQKHSRYYPFEGSVVFAGIRNVDNQALALLKNDDEIMVIAVDEAKAKQLKKLSIGSSINLSRDGEIKLTTSKLRR